MTAPTQYVGPAQYAAHPPRTRRAARTADRDTRVLLAVLGGAHSHDDVIAATGLSRHQVNVALHQLLWAGLVTWEPSLAGTLRPAVRLVR